MVDSLQLQRTQVFQHLQHCTDFAEAIRFEFGIYAVITYTQTIVSLCISIDLPTAVSILYPQRSIYSKRLAEVFPSQGCSHVVPDAVQAIETLSTGQATVSVDEGLEFARDDKTGSRIAVIRTNPMASNSIPQYELLPGRRESSMHHLTLWEVKQLDVTDVVYGVSFDDDRAAAFVRNSPWSALGPNDALTDFDSVPELLLQVLHTFMRYENVQKVRLALVIGAFLAVLEWDRPAVVKCPSLLTVVLGRNPSLLCQYVPQKDYSPTILMPLRRMMKNGQPSPALRAALYYLYVQDVPMASIIPDADIFDIGYFAHNPYVDDEDSDEDNGNGGDEKIDDEENSGDKENSGGEENSGDEENSNDEENEEENDDEEMGDEGGNVGEGGNIGEGGNVGDEYDTSYRRDVETLKRVFSDWWKTADIKITPEQDKMQLDQVSPEDMWDATYAPNQTPSTNALWG